MILRKLFLLFFTLAVAGWLFGFVYYMAVTQALSPQATDVKTDAIIVLTGGNNRIHTGLKLLREDSAPQLFITGVHPNYNPGHIYAMWQGDPKIAECCITLDYVATTTIGNAQETRRWTEENNISSGRIVTSKYHMPRALLEITAQNPDLKIIPHPVTEGDIDPRDAYFWQVIVSEYHKFIWRWCVLAAHKMMASYGI